MIWLWLAMASLGHLLVEVLGQLVEELEGVEVVRPGDVGHASLDAEGEVLGHGSGLDGLDAHGLKGLGEHLQLQLERMD